MVSLVRKFSVVSVEDGKIYKVLFVIYEAENKFAFAVAKGNQIEILTPQQVSGVRVEEEE